MDAKKQYKQIDILKLLFCVAVMLLHFRLDGSFLPGTHPVVDGFFIISGFLMMISLSKVDDCEPFKNGLLFVIKKYLKLLPYLFIAIVSGVTIYQLIYHFNAEELFLHNLPLVIFEFIPLQAVGFEGFWVTGVSWYLSAMFIAMLIIAPLVLKFKKNFVFYFCPLICIVLYGLNILIYHRLLPMDWMGPLSTGLSRGIAGICFGCLLYFIVKKLETINIKLWVKIVFTFIEAFIIAAFVYFAITFENTYFDGVSLILIIALLIISISGINVLEPIYKHITTKPLQKITLVLFLNHYAWARFVEIKYGDLPVYQQFLIFIAGAVALAAICYVLGTGITHIVHLIQRHQRKQEVKAS